MITQSILGISDNAIVILLLINVFLLIVGCFMDTTPAMLVLAPILLPVALSLGMSPVHFGLIMVVNLAIGFITPPLGINLFVSARIGNVPLETVTKGIVPFIFVMLVCLMLITYIPQISLLLPNMFVK
jgi:C4-dicarboxylate transporter DctM subunit